MNVLFRTITSRSMTNVACLTLGLAIITVQPAMSDDVPSSSKTSPLVQRNQVRLTLAGAELAIQAARKQAQKLELQVNITVVDEGGHPIAFARMDGARPASAYTSMTKASSAATKRAETGPLRPDEPNSTHLNLAVENAAAVSGGKFTTLKGGIPIVIDEQVIGAIGVGGATGEQDAEIAHAGMEALVKAVTQEKASQQN